jgi:Ca2+-binding RTX toxin-like protein
LWGERGNDTLDGGAGNDTLHGGMGEFPGEPDSDNFVFTASPGAANADVVTGFETGTDLMVLDPSAYTSIGGSGFFAPDDARYHSGAGVSSAHDGSDRVIYDTTSGQLWYDADGTGSIGTQLIATLQGAPTFVATDIFVAFGSGSGAVITGTAGDDSLVGTSGNDTINGLGGNDTLNGNGGSDSLNGGAGHDSLTGGGHPQDADGGDILAGGEGNDTLDGFNHALFSSDPDVDTMDGGLGDDVFWADNEADVLVDAGGTDTVHGLTNWTLGAGFENLVLHTGASEFGFGVGNELANHMSVTYRGSLSGMGGNDTLIGEGGTLDGGDGDDLIQGNLARFAEGGAGNDKIGGSFQATGGAGADVFHIDFFDSITDFATGTDTLLLDGAFPGFANSGPSGRFSAGDARFYAAAGADAAHDASDRLIYNTTTGDLYYDSDGTGGNSAFHLGVLDGAPTLAATDIEVIHGTAPEPIVGTEGNDTLTGTSGNDTIDGLGGDDLLSGEEGADSLIGGAGNDWLSAGFVNFGEGNFGDESLDTLDGGLGDDRYVVGQGDIILADPGGVDSVTTQGNIGWTLGPGLENLRTEGNFGHGWGQSVGNELDNHISAFTDGAALFGMGGNDYLVVDSGINSQGYEGDGGTGNDTLEASGGNSGSTLTGGAGADTFFITHAFGDVTITDFTSNTDQIRLDATNMGALGPSGEFSVNDERFHIGAAAAEADDRVIWNPGTRELFYDSDGSGSGSALRLATLQVGATVAATDIEVVNGTEPEPIIGTAGNDTLTGTFGNDTINGLGGNDSISGLEGADSLIGGAGNDTLVAGLDSTTGDHAADTLDGGLGDDVYHHVTSGEDIVLPDPGGIDTVFAIGDYTLGEGLDNLEFDDFTGTAYTGTGNALNNTMGTATEGGTLFGMGGDDTLFARHVQNSASLHGGEGNDTLHGGGRSTSMSGDNGNDVLLAGILSVMAGGAGADHFVFEEAGSASGITDFASGADKIRLDASTMTALGTTGNFAAGDERFHAGAAAAEADDRVIWNAATGELFYDADGSGAGGAELITTVSGSVVATDIIVDNGTAPEPGGEVITGTSGNDSLVGTNGNDTLDGVSGNDTLNGLLGDDTYIAQAGDVIQDSGGTDTLVTTSTWNIFSLPIENVTLAGSANIGLLANNLDNHVIGNSAANSIEGRGGSDTIEGGGGNDYFKMTTGGGTSFGFDVIDGGDGIDTVDYGGTALSDLDVDLVAGTVSGGDAGGGGGATITSIEKFISGNFNDRVSGSAENNQLLGNGGNDTLLGLAGHDSLNGGDGNDVLEGGSGFDTLVGGAGNDSFVFSATGGRVTDFTSADQLLFDNTFFAALGAESTWAAGDGRFRAAAGATTGADGDDRLVYNTTNGNLYYDADGAGGTGSVLVTTLQSAPTLSAADITVI